MKKNGKMVYVPPTVEVVKVILEGVIAASGPTPVQHIELKPWENDPDAGSPPNNSDIYLNF